ncbi:MAG: hypothetical protein GXP31_14025 [Kiritimatiellaeota bacterium]|nr:hypothetical protein [Kiritimatiellota bacterium]
MEDLGLFMGRDTSCASMPTTTMPTKEIPAAIRVNLWTGVRNIDVPLPFDLTSDMGMPA